MRNATALHDAAAIVTPAAAVRADTEASAALAFLRAYASSEAAKIRAADMQVALRKTSGGN